MITYYERGTPPWSKDLKEMKVRLRRITAVHHSAIRFSFLLNATPHNLFNSLIRQASVFAKTLKNKTNKTIPISFGQAKMHI